VASIATGTIDFKTQILLASRKSLSHIKMTKIR